MVAAAVCGSMAAANRKERELVEQPPDQPSIRRWASRLEPRWVFLVLLGVALLALAVHFPTTGDDWAWGSKVGVERWHEHFADYNGRYLGNIAVLLLTRASWIAPVVVAVVLCLLVLMIAELADSRRLSMLSLAAALLVSMPLTQWRQTVPWLSGFTNYVLGGFCLAVFAVSVLRDLTRTRPPLPWWRAVLVFVFAVASTLFIENVTIMLVLGSLAWLALGIFRPGRRVSVRAAAWAAGTVVGAALMFSNSAYRHAGDASRYQSIGPAAKSGATGLKGIVLQGTHGVSQLAVVDNTVLNAALLSLIVALAFASRAGAGRLRAGQWAAAGFAAVAVAGSVAISSTVPAGKYFGSATDWSWVPAGALLVAILLAAWSLVADRARAATVVGLAVGVVVLVAPMAAVSPYGPRTFLPSYVLMSGIAVVLLAELLSRTDAVTVGRVITSVALATLLTALAGYWAVYRAVDHAARERIDALHAAVDRGRTTVTLVSLPFSDYVHNSEPHGPSAVYYFHTYYGLPARLVVKFRSTSVSR